MKKLHIKIWPEIEGYLPVILPWQKIENRENTLFIDFTNCSKVRASGLNILLIRMIKLLQKNNRNWETSNSVSNPNIDKVVKLNFFHFLEDYQLNSIFKQENTAYNANPLVESDSFGNEIHSFPVYCIRINDYIEKRRDILKDFKKWIYLLLEQYYNDYDFNISQLVLILNEIVKNSADHTSDNAFIGIDILFNNDKSKIKLLFSIGDLGKGININVKDNLPVDITERLDYWDLTQTYRAALSRGFTTKNKSIDNKGIGMSIILDGSKQMGLKLSVFDAESRGILSNIESLSHQEIRKHFYDIGNPVGFYYLGELNANKI